MGVDHAQGCLLALQVAKRKGKDGVLQNVGEISCVKREPGIHRLDKRQSDGSCQCLPAGKLGWQSTLRPDGRPGERPTWDWQIIFAPAPAFMALRVLPLKGARPRRQPRPTTAPGPKRSRKKTLRFAAVLGAAAASGSLAATLQAAGPAAADRAACQAMSGPDAQALSVRGVRRSRVPLQPRTPAPDRRSQPTSET